jgi:ATP-dependent exoDNAse (exonuclease V) beta subunit
VLREHALRLGIDPEFAPLAEQESGLLVGETVRDTLLSLLESGDAAALRLCAAYPPQRIARTLAGMLRAEAGLERLVRRHAACDAGELRRAWDAAVQADAAEHLARVRRMPEVAEFIRRLEEFAGQFRGAVPDGRERIRLAQLGVLRALAAGEPAGAVARALAVVADCGQNRATKEWEPEAKEPLKQLQDAVKDWCARHLAPLEDDPDAVAACAALTVDLLAVHAMVRAGLEAAKLQANRLSFDDLIARTLDALRESEALRDAVAGGIDTLLIDEFQDTDAQQLEIAEMLHAAADGPDLFIVGDAKQSIYYFRGAEVEVFAEARGRAARVERLDANFRTAPALLAFVNDYFTRSAALHAVEAAYHPMQAGRAAAAPWPPVEMLLHLPARGNREALRTAEAAMIAHRIAQLLDARRPDSGVWDAAAQAPRPAQPGDIAILFRGMSNVGIYEDALRRAGIPYTLASGSGFYERQEVVDVLNALRVVLDPCDEPALLGFLRSPMAGLSDDAIYLWTKAAGSLARAFAAGDTAILAATGAEDDAVRARDLVAGLRALPDADPGRVLRQLLAGTHYEAVLLSQYLGLQKAANVRKLVAQADTFQYGGVRSLRAFVRYLADVRSNAVREGEAALPGTSGAVQLLTIHKSKGLEFPVVFLADTASPLRVSDAGDLLHHRALGLVFRAPDEAGAPCSPPLAQAIQRRVRREEIAEHARLLYVALTRARDRLLIAGAHAAGEDALRTPPEGSWLAALDQVFRFMSPTAGDRLEGKGWEARIVRDISAMGMAPAAGADEAPPDADRLLRQTAPLPPPRRGDTYSVSALLDALAGGLDADEERQPEESPRTGASAGAQSAMLRGALVHQLFEGWDFARGQAPDIDALLAAAPLTGAQARAWRDDLAQIAGRFARSDLHGRMRAAGPVLREAPFHLYLPGCDAGVAGVMDAVLADGTIVDYKTGAPHPDRHARYEWQLLLYGAAYQDLRGQAPREGLIYYVDHDRVTRVDFAPSELDAARRHAEELIARLRAG